MRIPSEVLGWGMGGRGGEHGEEHRLPIRSEDPDHIGGSCLGPYWRGWEDVVVHVGTMWARGLFVSDALLPSRLLLCQRTDRVGVNIRQGRRRQVFDVTVVS